MAVIGRFRHTLPSKGEKTENTNQYYMNFKLSLCEVHSSTDPFSVYVGHFFFSSMIIITNVKILYQLLVSSLVFKLHLVTKWAATNMLLHILDKCCKLPILSHNIQALELATWFCGVYPKMINERVMTVKLKRKCNTWSIVQLHHCDPNTYWQKKHHSYIMMAMVESCGGSTKNSVKVVKFK